MDAERHCNLKRFNLEKWMNVFIFDTFAVVFFAVFETCCRHCHEPCGLSQILSTASDPQRQVCGSSLQAYDCARGTLSADMLITHIRNPYCWPTILQPLQFVHRGGYQVSLYLITRVAVHPHVIVRVY